MNAAVELTVLGQNGEDWKSQPCLVNVHDFKHSDLYAERIRTRLLRDVDEAVRWMRENL